MVHAFIRRYVKLDKEAETFSFLRDEKHEVEDVSPNTAYNKLLVLLDERETANGVIPNGGRFGLHRPYEGMHYDRELEYPQLHTMDRMHFSGNDIVDFVFYTENGRYNGENCNYLNLGGIVYTYLPN